MSRPPSPPTALAPRRTARGYTAVEVLMAMTVMTIGAAAVISMQKASVQGNLDARKTDVANSIARTWVERLQRDAMQWTLPNSANPAGNNIGNALLISGNVTGLWFRPTQYLGSTPETMSPGFDILGRDLPSASMATAQFCVNVRLTWLVPAALGASPPEPGLIRADVRVLWPRGILGGAPSTGFCDDTVGTVADPELVMPAAQRPFFHTIYLTTTIKENAQ
jgi:prepilin-type N-terminal cleavage/methylation domain-containing protein